MWVETLYSTQVPWSQEGKSRDGAWVPTCDQSPQCTPTVVDSFPGQKGLQFRLLSEGSPRLLVSLISTRECVCISFAYICMCCHRAQHYTWKPHFSHQGAFILNQSSGAKRARFPTLFWPSPLLPNSSAHLRALTSAPRSAVNKIEAK